VADQATSGAEGDPGIVMSHPDRYLFRDAIHPNETSPQRLGTQAIPAAAR